MPLIKAGKLRALVQTGAKRWFELPDTPTMEEVGIANAYFETLQVLLGPQNMPGEITDRLSKAVVKALAAPELREQLLKDRLCGFRNRLRRTQTIDRQGSRQVARRHRRSQADGELNGISESVTRDWFRHDHYRGGLGRLRSRQPAIGAIGAFGPLDRGRAGHGTGSRAGRCARYVCLVLLQQVLYVARRDGTLAAARHIAWDRFRPSPDYGWRIVGDGDGGVAWYARRLR